MTRANSARFEHITFPRLELTRTAVNLAPKSPLGCASDPQSDWCKDEADFVMWLLGKVGIDASSYRPETLKRRLPASLRTIRARSCEHARELLAKRPEALPLVVSAILVGVTSFFRDPTVFQQLSLELQRMTDEKGQGIYGWSIGCSEGAELYSLAIQLAELGQLSTSYLLGTDCRADAIERARSANYESVATSQVPTEFVLKYFDRNGSCFRLLPAIRQSTRWRVCSILNEFETGLWDVIFFRNTALYMRQEVLSTLWPKLEASLRPGGLLVLGRAERPTGTQRLRNIGPCLYRRQAR